MLIELSELTKDYDSFRAVNHISFQINRGEIVGFLGPNGAGKTTTLKILTCYMSPTSGTAKVAGFDIYDDSLEVRRRIGYLPESNALYPEMNVLDFLVFSAQMRHIPKSEIKTRIKQVIADCGLGDQLLKDIGELSKGLKQRLGLAQAILHEPDILILDEPTSGLDPNQIVEIRRLIRELGQEKTVILSTHVLQEVQAVCSRIIVINKGKIVADNSREELQSAQGRERVYLQVQAAEDALAVLSKVQGVGRVSVRDQSAGITGYEVEAGTEEDIRPALFHCAVQNKWTILEMRREIASLEDVFRRLTVEGTANENSGESQ